MNETDQQELLRLFAVLNRERRAGLPMDVAVFEASLKVFPQVAIETVFLRRVDDGSTYGEVQVLLTQRPADDPGGFALQLHSPGSFNRCRERTEDTIGRVVKRELGGSARLISAQQVAAMNFWDGRRGHGWSIVYCCVVEGAPAHGQWYPITKLPHNLVDGHVAIIMVAASVLLADVQPYNICYREPQ